MFEGSSKSYYNNLIEHFSLSNDLFITRYSHRDKVTPIDDKENYSISKAILTSVHLSTGQKLGQKELLAIASYPLVDVLNPMISSRCNWMILKSRKNQIVGVVLDYFGENNFRYFFNGESKAIKIFLKEFPKTNGIATHPDDFRIVVPAWQIKEAELSDLLGNNWQLRDPPEEVTRIYNPLKDYTQREVLLEKKFEVIELDDRYHDSIISLLENYPHHSYKRPVGHIGIIDRDTGEIVSLSGILAQAQLNGFLPITLTGNLVTRSGYERQGLALAARTATLNKIKEDPLYGQGIVVSDANEMSLPLNQKLGYKPILINSGTATFWWCIYRRVI